MKRDYLRRVLVKDENINRLRLNGLRKNTILPRELQSVADKQIAALPYRSSITHLSNRCAVTSRGVGNVLKWRVSRFMFRHMCDYNKMAGGMRAHWLYGRRPLPIDERKKLKGFTHELSRPSSMLHQHTKPKQY